MMRSSFRKNILGLIFAFGVVLETLVIRIMGINLYDIHIDEITYAHFAQTIDAGQLPRDFGGAPFFLHPPGYFVLLAIWRALFWHGTNIFAEYTLLRGLSVFLAVPTVILIILLVQKLTKNLWLGVVAGTLFMIDPFAIRQNTRGLMETDTMMWLLFGLWLLFERIEKNVSGWIWSAIGLVFGIAIVTKDVAAIFLVLVFVLMMLLKIGPNRKVYRYLVPTALAPYALWVGIVSLRGYFWQFLASKTVGIQRLIGLFQQTGFNSPNSPSKGSALMQTIPLYGISYVVMATGALGSILLLTSKDKNRRRWGAVGTAATLLLSYLVVGGTFEEQYLYYLMIPAIISSVVAAFDLWERIHSGIRDLVFAVSLLELVLVLLVCLSNYVVNMSTPDDGWTVTAEWVDTNIPAGSSICAWEQGEFLLVQSPNNYDVCDWSTQSALAAHHVQYVLESETLSNSGYEPVSPDELATLKSTTKLVFTYDSRDTGVFDVFQLTAPPNPQAVQATAAAEATP